MRSDFLGACPLFHQLSAVLSAHQELVGPMTAAELREAIERPAFLVGCEVEPPLTERLLADVKGQSGALPLLQFALTEVWNSAMSAGSRSKGTPSWGRTPRARKEASRECSIIGPARSTAT